MIYMTTFYNSIPLTMHIDIALALDFPLEKNGLWINVVGKLLIKLRHLEVKSRNILLTIRVDLVASL